MATQLIGSAFGGSYTHSIATSQTGLNVETMTVSREPEFREQLLNTTGHVQGEAVGDPTVTLTISGETIRSTGGAYLGLLLDDFGADDTAGLTFHVSKSLTPGTIDALATEFVCQSQEVTQTRGTWETATVVYKTYKNMTVA